MIDQSFVANTQNTLCHLKKWTPYQYHVGASRNSVVQEVRTMCWMLALDFDFDNFYCVCPFFSLNMVFYESSWFFALRANIYSTNTGNLVISFSHRPSSHFRWILFIFDIRFWTIITRLIFVFLHWKSVSMTTWLKWRPSRLSSDLPVSSDTIEFSAKCSFRWRFVRRLRFHWSSRQRKSGRSCGGLATGCGIAWKCLRMALW